MAQKKCFVEYMLKPGDAGYADRPLGISLPRRAPLNFLPNPDYDNRRIESFDTEAEAAAFCEAYFQSKIFQICDDLLSVNERRLIRTYVEEIVRPLVREEIHKVLAEGPRIGPAPSPSLIQKKPGK